MSILFYYGAYTQSKSLTLSFTALNDTSLVQLDSVMIRNLTQGGQNMTYWPDNSISIDIGPGDTMLYIGYSDLSPIVGIFDPGHDKNTFLLSQNYPNPVIESSIVELYLPHPGNVDISITDIKGRLAFKNHFHLSDGQHTFKLSPGTGMFFIISATWNGITQSIKVLNTGRNHGQKCMFQVCGMWCVVCGG
jgi:hypothetical protein